MLSISTTTASCLFASKVPRGVITSTRYLVLCKGTEYSAEAGVCCKLQQGIICTRCEFSHWLVQGFPQKGVYLCEKAVPSRVLAEREQAYKGLF